MTRRDGVTLVELLGAMTVGAIVAAVLTTTVLAQERAYAAIAARTAARGQLRDAASVLQSVTRFTAPGDSLLSISDTAFEVRVITGAAVTCGGSGATLVLAPDTLLSGAPMGGFATVPEVGDGISSYDDSTGWHYTTAAGVATTTTSGCDPRFPVAAFDPRATAYSIALSTAMASPLPVGAPIRVWRRMRVSTYRAADGAWYLGVRGCTPSGCATVQPVAGPFDAPLANRPPFSFADRSGDVTHSAGSATRLDFVLRATTTPIRFPGTSSRRVSDSAVGAVAVRNAP